MYIKHQKEIVPVEEPLNVPVPTVNSFDVSSQPKKNTLSSVHG
jgi:hypothetical protein